jgi:hypothetical protein
MPPALVEAMHAVEFVILNDDQTATIEVEDQGFIFTPPTFTPRDNVVLTAWYQDEALTIWHDFDAPITSSLTLYSQWRYRGTSLSPAILRASEQGERFESETMTLHFDLYEPLAYQVRYQWQSARVGDSQFEDIGGATLSYFSPYRNGRFQYRLEYKVPLYNDANLVTGSIPYYTSPIVIDIYGQQTFLLPILITSFLALFGLVYFFQRKRKIYFDVMGGQPLPPEAFRVGEDTSLLPKAKKKGYRFKGWYFDPQYENPFKGMRMPLKSMRLYAKYTPQKNQ